MINIGDKVYFIYWSYNEGRDFSGKNEAGRGVYIKERPSSGIVYKTNSKSISVDTPSGESVTVSRDLVFNSRRACQEAINDLNDPDY